MITKIEFCDAINEVLNRTSAQQPTVIHTIYANDILSYTEPKYLIVGDGLFSYNITDISIKIRLSSLTPILDDYSFPIPMDDLRILNKYMMYVYDGLTNPIITSYFILNLDTDWDYLNDLLLFSATTMIGVINKYMQANATITLNQITSGVPTDIQVPRPLRFDRYTLPPANYNLPDSPYLVNLSTNVRSVVSSIFATTVINIFSLNNKNGTYSYFWTAQVENNVNIPREQLIDINTILDRPFLLMTSANYLYYTLFLPYQFALLNLQNRFLGWASIINTYMQVSNALFQNNFDYDTYEAEFNIGNNSYKYRQYSAIDFFWDPDGLTWAGLYALLVANNFFYWSGGNIPAFITSLLELIPAGQPCIGNTIVRPEWLDQSNKYYYRNPDNDGERRTLKIAYLMLGTRAYQRPNTGASDRYLKVRLYTTKLDYNGTGINNLYTDTGWILHYETYGLTTLNLWNSTVARYAYPLYYDNPTSFNVGNDDFLSGYANPNNSLKHSYSFFVSLIERTVSNYVTNTNVLTDIIVSNVPLIIDSLTIDHKVLDAGSNPVTYTIPEINSALLLFQLMTYTNLSILQQYTANNYNSAASMAYTRKWLTNTLLSLDLTFIALPDDYVTKYKYIPFYLTKPDSKQYSVFIDDVMAKQLTDSFMRSVINRFRLKISLSIIGLTTIDIFSNRYFKFKGRKFACTSVQYDTTNNVTIIEGYGG